MGDIWRKGGEERKQEYIPCISHHSIHWKPLQKKPLALTDIITEKGGK
jgi:hypothetical protein